MSVLDTLITDRTAADVQRLRYLLSLGWANMTAEEQSEYLNGGNAPLYDANGQQLYDSQGEPLYSNDAGGVQKGAYNYTDLNRVEEAVDYVAGELVQADTDLRAYAASLNVAWDPAFEVPYDPQDYSLTVKTDWEVTDIPSATQMTRYIGNLILIRDAIQDASNAWIPDTMDGLDYELANNIEKMLIDVDTAVALLVATKEGMIRSALAVNYSGEIYSGEGEA